MVLKRNSLAYQLRPEQELRSALLWNRPVCRTLSVLLFELTYLHVIGYCPPHGSNPVEVQLFPAAAWVFGCGLAWGRGDRKLRTGLRHYRRTGRCGSRQLRARRVDHGSPPSTPLVCAKCQVKMRIISALTIQNPGSSTTGGPHRAAIFSFQVSR